jgi:hypothetical protein
MLKKNSLPPVKKKIQQISNFNYNANHRKLLLVRSLCNFSCKSVAFPITRGTLLCCVLIRPTLSKLADGHLGPFFFKIRIVCMSGDICTCISLDCCFGDLEL